MWDHLTWFIGIGFAAQMVDGAVGMAYGIISTTALLGIGVAPAVASACVHAAETFTTGASGYSHWRMGNVDKRMVLRLAVPGMIGGALGAYALTRLPGEAMRVYVSAYLLILGLVILWRVACGARSTHTRPPTRHVAPLGFFGGMLDAIGGGGWGPIVTSTLVGNGMAPRIAIGSVNLAEFFVTLTISATFLFTIGLELWPIIAGLVIGGVIAAPLAAYATRYLPERALLSIVALIVIVVSTRGLLRTFG